MVLELRKAKVRIQIDRSKALREIEEVERKIEGTKKQRVQEDRTQARARQGERTVPTPGGKGGGSAAGPSKFAISSLSPVTLARSLPFGIGTAFRVAEVAAEFGPGLKGFVKEILGGDKPLIDATKIDSLIGKTIAAQINASAKKAALEAVEEINKKFGSIERLKAIESGLQAATAQLSALSRLQAISTGDISIDDLKSEAKAVFKIASAQEALRRKAARDTREFMGEAGGRILKDILKGAMTGSSN